MDKKFAFLRFHVIEDHKHTFSVDNREFFQNPVMLKTDRFLEKELRDKMQLGIKRPYTLVVDTAGCNKNCWFCYAYPIVKKEDYDFCKTISLSPEKLATCFVDKLRALRNVVKHKDRFFSKLRVTGGEPLYSTEDTFTGIDVKDYSFDTITYFLKFFESLDPQIGVLVREKTIFLSPPRKYSDDVPFPTFLCYNGRMEIRFDTNGFLFREAAFAEKFVGGLHSLFESRQLNNLLVKIDFSFKGVHPLEVYWSQKQRLPVDRVKVGDFRIEDHPQYAGLKNILDLIRTYNGKSPGFGSCCGITVEPGINNVERNFLNYEGSLNWKLLEQKLKDGLGISFKLSDVDNKMELGRGNEIQDSFEKRRSSESSF